MSSAWKPPVATGCVAVLLACLFAIPGSVPWFAGPAAFAASLVSAGMIAAAYVGAAAGIGMKFMGRSALALPVGAAAMLALSHLMGVAGFLRDDLAGAAAAWAPVLIGLALCWSGLRAPPPLSPPRNRARALAMLCLSPAIAALMLSACAPPGVLWPSEARGFDALSYHLQLPREWLALGRIIPLENNAYSWLPSYMEAAYTHLGALASPIWRDPFVAGDGPATIASQLLHAMFAVATAATIAALVRARALGSSQTADLVAGAIFLCTPWVLVTGSLAYNEMAVCLFLAGAIGACDANGLTPIRRGLTVGFLVGAACCAKPNALLMVGLPVALLFAFQAPRREWLRVFGAASVAGMTILAPWLLRNWNASGNPLFPYLASIFGSGHWTPLELARWHAGHHESAGALERIGLLFSARGFGHAQYLFGLPVGCVIAALGLFSRRSHLVVAPLVLMTLVQIVMWLLVGHLQSRFLIPTLVPMAIAAGLVLSDWHERPGAVRRLIAPGLLAVMGLAAPAPLLLDSRRGAPEVGFVVAAGVGTMTGEALRAVYEEANPGEREQIEREIFGPAQWINVVGAPTIQRLYLLGDSTPFYFRVPVLYHTTWDASPLGEAMRGRGDALGGVSHVLVNFAELRRLRRDGWYDPDVSPEAVLDLMLRRGREIRRWTTPEGGESVLFEITQVEGTSR